MREAALKRAAAASTQRVMSAGRASPSTSGRRLAQPVPESELGQSSSAPMEEEDEEHLQLFEEEDEAMEQDLARGE